MKFQFFNFANMNIFEKLGQVLPSVESPARYMGGEANSVVKDPSSLLARMAFVFPDLYEIGLSNNGLRVLYHVVNREPDLLMEVAFALGMIWRSRCANRVFLYTPMQRGLLYVILIWLGLRCRRN